MVGLWVAACNSSPSPKSACLTGSAQEQMDRMAGDYCQPMARQLCARAQACGCDALSMWDGEDACVENWSRKCLRSLEALRSRLEDGEVRFCPDAARACVQAYQPVLENCLRGRPSGNPPAACVQMLAMTASWGDSCSEPGFGCADGSGICDLADGVCRHPPQAEEPCEGVCAAGWVCGSEGLCVEGASLQPCRDRRDCQSGLFCVLGACGNALVSGEGCETDDECFPGLFCDPDAMECRLPGPACDAPDACGTNAACVPGDVRRCKPRRGVGEPCAGHEECQPDSWCDQGVCVLRPQDAEPCAEGVLCAPGFACSMDSGECIRMPGEGEPCALDMSGPFVCGAGLACVNGVCGPLPGEGQPCGQGNHACAEGLGCSFHEDGTNICEPRVHAGDPCSNDSQCVEGTYCDFASMKCVIVHAVGESCRYGNECGPLATCLQAEPGAEAVCAPIPNVGEPCFFVCEGDAFCAPPDGTCAPPICIEVL